MDLNSSPWVEREERRHGGQMRQRSGIWNQNREDRNRLTKRKYPYDNHWNVSRPSTHDPAYRDRNSRPYGGNTIPPGWLDCPVYGREIGYIIPSKVPLGESFNDYILGEKYTPKQAIDQQRHFGRELGLVIDLTNTDRYYPISDWKEEGIDYVKIRCQGRDSVPDNDSVDKFLDEVSRFCTRQVHPKKYILVHCTHGHNRTGYMIVHYLVRSESISVTEAIATFARARQPGIYKEDYIEALYMFYNERKPETVVCPPTPEWKSLPDPDTDGSSFSTCNNSGKSSSLVDAVTGNIMTSDDVLGDPIPSNQQQSMRQKCYQLLQLGAGAKGLVQFPGSHPVSLNSDNLQLLRQRYYYATWKADGTRYMMLITWEGCYLIDRKFNFQRVQMRFPCQSNQGTAESTHHYTLLDGEMIIDTDPQTGKQERRYLIYDMMAINGDSVVELPFCERWKMLEKEVIEPRNAEREILSRTKTPYYRYDIEPFSVRRKAFWLLSTVSKLLKNFIPQLSHAADGLVFQGWDDPYVPRTHEGLLKWKYPEMNSVDFLFELGADRRPRLFVHERGKKKLMDKTRVVFKDTSDFTVYSGKIIECSWNPEGYHWVCMRIRVDKSTPNEFNTFRKVLRSIKDNITEDVLLNEIDQIIRLPMYADRIQNDIKAHQDMVSARRK